MLRIVVEAYSITTYRLSRYDGDGEVAKEEEVKNQF